MLKDALALGPPLPPVVSLPDSCRRFLLENRLPEEIIADLEACCFNEWVPIGRLSLVPLPEVVEQNEALRNIGLEKRNIGLRNGLVVLAAGANGDPIAIDCGTREMVFVEHSGLAYNFAPPEAGYQASPFKYEDFWQAAVSQDGFPWDFYEAKRQWAQGGRTPPDDPPWPRLADCWDDDP